MRSTLSLSLLPGLLWPRMVAPDGVLSIGQIELNSVLLLKIWNDSSEIHFLMKKIIYIYIYIYICIIFFFLFNLSFETKGNQQK